MDFTGLAVIHTNKSLEVSPEDKVTRIQKYDVVVKGDVFWSVLIEHINHCPLG